MEWIVLGSASKFTELKTRDIVGWATQCRENPFSWFSPNKHFPLCKVSLLPLSQLIRVTSTLPHSMTYSVVSLHSLFEFNTPLVLIFLSPHFQPFPLGLLLVVCLVSFSFLFLGLVSNPLSRIILVYVDHIDLVVSKTHIGHVLGL